MLSATSKQKITPFFDTCNEDTKKNLDQALARAIFSGAIPLSFIENQYFINFLNLIRPSYQPPGRRALSTVLLEKEYLLVQDCIKKKLKLPIHSHS